MTTYALGPFRLDTQDDLLFRGREPVALGRRAIALLRALLERPGAVVLKEVLVEAAWPGQAVEDSNLTVQIAALRRVLGGAPGGDRWIETMPRRGYRFTGPVVAEMENGGMPPLTAIEAAEGHRPTPHRDAERRQITALSCELVGVAAGAHGRHLEDLCEAVREFRRCVSETAGRHEGFVYTHLGNNALALFGYPFAHEHDVERAVRVGLELCAAVGALTSGPAGPMRCRVGIATGMVIVGERARNGEGRDCQIIGETPDLAALLRISAQPGAVVIDQVTRKLIGNLFDCRDLDTIETDGGGEPMRRWQMLGESAVASRFEAMRGSALTPLIGRDEEIDLLLRRWARAKARIGQVVLLSGEPGIGKSRVAVALGERLQTEPCCYLRYFCSPHHQDSALFPFIDQLGRASGFARDDPPTTKLGKLGALLSRTEPPDEDVTLLADLLSLAASERHAPPHLSPQRKKERTLEALIRHLEGLARQSPLLIVFEDAHWIDPTSRELLDLVVDRLRTLPALLIVTFRPEFQAPWTGQAQVTILALSRFDRRERTALITQIAGHKALPDEVVIQIADRTDGVPLFVEELTKSVLESGQLREEADRYVLDGALPTLAIPTSLHASLIARLDRSVLGRRVAQIGAAIGREFGYALLRDLGGLAEHELQGALAQLVASELVFQRGVPPDAVYSFRHALVQNAAHGSLLRNDRQQLHAQIAEVLETQCSGVMDTQPELLAQHFAAAGLVEKAVTYWSKAGHRSVARSAMAEAAAQFQRALDQLALLPANIRRKREELELLRALGGVLLAVKGMAAPEMHAVFSRARELWEQLGSPSEFLQIPYGQSRYHAYRGELDLALRIDEDLIRLSRERNDTAGLVMGYGSSGRTLMLLGRFSASYLHFGKALALFDPTCHRSLVHETAFHLDVMLEGYLGIVLYCRGFPQQALIRAKSAIVEARKLAHPPSLAATLAPGVLVASQVEDDSALGEWADQMITITTDQGFPLWRALGTIFRAWALIRNGGVGEGMPLLRGALKAFQATSAEGLITCVFGPVARAFEIAGQFEEALTALDHGLQIGECTGAYWFAAELTQLKGELQLRHGNTEVAEKLYCKALSVAREQEARLWELRSATNLARLWRDQGRCAAARDLLAPVYGWFTEGFATPDLKAAKMLLGELNA